MNSKEEKALKDFLMDIDCLRALEKWENDFNIFEVLKITNAEIRHSNFLAWLFDPNEKHELGDSFIKGFITLIVKKTETIDKDVISILLQDFYSYRVYREHIYKNNKRMDIVLVSEKEQTVVVIENKIWSDEGYKQLADYHNIMEDEFSNYKHKYCVFLTPEGDDPSESDWVPISYDEILDILKQAKDQKTLSEGVSLLLSDYEATVRRSIVKSKDEGLIKLCEEIYNKHRTALRLIFDNVQVDDSLESEIISEVLNSNEKKGRIIQKRKSRLEFHTPDMDKYLPELKTENSSYKTSWIYYYWFDRRRPDQLRLHLELGLENLSDEQNEKVKKLIIASGKKEGGRRYKRLSLWKEKLPEEKDYEEALEKATEKLINKALENEKKLLNKVKIEKET